MLNMIKTVNRQAGVGRLVRNVAVAAGVFCLSATSAYSAPITFGAATSIGGGITSLTQLGTVVQAINFGSGSTLAAGGITFTAAAPGDILEVENVFSDPTVYTNPPVVDANFQDIIRSFAWDTNGAQVGPPSVPANTLTMSLSGLTIGNIYEVQLFAVDQRAAGAGRTTTFNSFDALTGAVTGTAGTVALDAINGNYVIGSFIADATTQTIRTTGNASAYINALVLRQTGTTVPEINTAGCALPFSLFSLYLVALYDRRRRLCC